MRAELATLAVAPALFACMLLASTAAAVVLQDDCYFEKRALDGKFYAYDLTRPLDDLPLGVVSTAGYYRIDNSTQQGEPLSDLTVWFQLCRSMKFVSSAAAPYCGSQCPQSCGGDLHCGETCGALVLRKIEGYPFCFTLGQFEASSLSFIDDRRPALGVAVNISQGDNSGCPAGVRRSLTVNLLCKGQVEPEVSGIVSELSPCIYVTDMVHPVACPLHMGSEENRFGASTVIVLLIAVVILYLLGGIAYNNITQGSTGLEAVPNIDFWRITGQVLKTYSGMAWEKVTGWVRRPSGGYMPVS
eukprot:jgi/Chlat1/732/Chrsp104S01212